MRVMEEDILQLLDSGGAEFFLRCLSEVLPKFRAAQKQVAPEQDPVYLRIQILVDAAHREADALRPKSGVEPLDYYICLCGHDIHKHGPWSGESRCELCDGCHEFWPRGLGRREARRRKREEVTV